VNLDASALVGMGALRVGAIEHDGLVAAEAYGLVDGVGWSLRQRVLLRARMTK
jgi:hypothetical protein